MIVAFEEFNIPMIITPEDLSNPNLDEKSALTYLSYFMKEHGVGYNLIMNWLHRILPDRQIHNLTVSNYSRILLRTTANHDLGRLIGTVESTSVPFSLNLVQ